MRHALERSVETRLKDKNRENDLRVLRGQVGAPGASSAGAGSEGRGRSSGGGKGQGKGKGETLCRFFTKGLCKKGKDCEWSHDSTRHSPAPRSKTPKGKGRGRGKGKDRSSSPAQDKTKPCWRFQTKECSYTASTCRWAHRRATPEELASRPPQRPRTASPAPVLGKGGKPVCFSWRDTKTCVKGDKCRYEHVGGPRVASLAARRRARRRSKSAGGTAAESDADL